MGLVVVKVLYSEGPKSAKSAALSSVDLTGHPVAKNTLENFSNKEKFN